MENRTPSSLIPDGLSMRGRTAFFYVIFVSRTRKGKVLKFNDHDVRTTVKKSLTLIQFLKEQYPDSPRTRIKKFLTSGAVRINSRRVTLHSSLLQPGDIVEINPHTGASSGNLFPFPVLFEDKDILVVDKPAGISTSSTDGSRSVYGILSEVLKQTGRGKSRTFVVHRLDKEVSGVLLFAKSYEVMNVIKENWKDTDKHYYALVEGMPKEREGTVKSWLIEDKSQKVHSTYEREGAKFSVTHYKTIRQINNYTLLDVSIDTGRKNQIRVHLSDLGCPIAGDRKYGASDKYKRRVRLHAYLMSIPHPVTRNKITFESPMPESFLRIKDKDEHYK